MTGPHEFALALMRIGKKACTVKIITGPRALRIYFDLRLHESSDTFFAAAEGVLNVAVNSREPVPFVLAYSNVRDGEYMFHDAATLDRFAMSLVMGCKPGRYSVPHVSDDEIPF